MNLYRNFGSTLEMWVATKDSEQEGKDSNVVQGRHETPSMENDRMRRRSIREVRGAMLRSESEDSGVETENAPSTPGSLYHGFSPLREEPREFGNPWGSNRHSMPPLSSHSFTCVSLNTPALEETDTARSRVTVEQALRRASQSSTVGPSQTPPLGRADSTRHIIEHLRCNSMNTGQRSGGPRDPKPSPLEPHSTGQDPEPPSLQPYPSRDETDSLSHCEDSTSLHASHKDGAPTGKGPAPGLQHSPTLGPSAPRGPSLGLGYLEQVCRMLEEIAHLQLRNLELQRENERIRNRQCVHCRQKSSFGQHLPIFLQNPVDVSQSSDCVDAPDQPSREHGLLRARERPISDIWELVRAQGEMEKQKRMHWSGRAGETSNGNEPSVAQEKRGRNHRGIRLKTGSLNRGTALLLSGRRLAGSSGKNGAKKIGLLFKKKGKNTPTG
ncbi:hypothetical protein GJAV_G00050040 [Gymnothorax javanicus]|nr:hypothetical protein GJAV_G00050040 [Gymnothorax javanicus]